LCVAYAESDMAEVKRRKGSPNTVFVMRCHGSIIRSIWPLVAKVGA